MEEPDKDWWIPGTVLLLVAGIVIALVVVLMTHTLRW